AADRMPLEFHRHFPRIPNGVAFVHSEPVISLRHGDKVGAVVAEVLQIGLAHRLPPVTHVFGRGGLVADQDLRSDLGGVLAVADATQGVEPIPVPQVTYCQLLDERARHMCEVLVGHTLCSCHPVWDRGCLRHNPSPKAVSLSKSFGSEKSFATSTPGR